MITGVECAVRISDNFADYCQSQPIPLRLVVKMVQICDRQLQVQNRHRLSLMVIITLLFAWRMAISSRL